MVLQNGVEIEIHKTWYNKTVIQPDGITHIVDTSKQYTAFQFGLAKNYFDAETKDEVVDEIIKDLQSTIRELEMMKQKHQRQEGAREDLQERA